MVKTRYRAHGPGPGSLQRNQVDNHPCKPQEKEAALLTMAQMETPNRTGLANPHMGIVPCLFFEVPPQKKNASTYTGVTNQNITSKRCTGHVTNLRNSNPAAHHTRRFARPSNAPHAPHNCGGVQLGLQPGALLAARHVCACGPPNDFFSGSEGFG